ncbi:TPA: AAA family ATPase [Clostridium botulinum]|nr:AAA family ATPase [Clostridium botulinum]
MAKRKIGRIRQVKKDIASYTYLMNGVAGIGKTTTVCEIGQKEFGMDGFLLLTIGQEPEPEHIGNLWNERVEDWDDLEDVIETLCEYKNEDYPDLKMIGIDSVDEIFRLAETKVIELHNKKVTNPTDKVDTIKKCFGGLI